MDKQLFESRMREKDKRYSENFAKALLAIKVNPDFAKAENSECPDLKLKTTDSSVGVEVTRLICSYFVALRHYSKIWSSKKMSLEQIVMSLPPELRDSLGINNSGHVVPLKSLGDKIGINKMKKQIGNIYKGKLTKLQKYEKFDQNNLFIFATELNPNMSESQIYAGLKTMIDTRKYETTYDKVYVFTYNKLLIYGMKKPYREIISVDDDDINTCNKYANQMVKNNTSQVLHNYFAEDKLEK